MVHRIDMEATLPPQLERQLYANLLSSLKPEAYESAYEETFWEQSASYIQNFSNCLVDLCGLGADPRRFTDGDRYLRAAQWSALFRKRNDVGPEAARIHKAVNSFIEAEEMCRETNCLIQAVFAGKVQPHPTVVPVVQYAQSWIKHVLGDVPSIDTLPCYLGPGASTQVVRKEANVRVKLGQMFACSEATLPIVKTLLESMPDFIFRDKVPGDESASTTVEIHHSRLTFVPKNFSTYRSIAVEPWLNSFFQLGVGQYMASRLRKVGLDIRDQTLNQRLAKRGSIDGSLATIDLSSASDTVSLDLVRWLLPDEWVQLLLHLRSSTMQLDGSVTKLEKFSSMGNGFTFPLETLIFAALARGVCRSMKLPGSDVIAYGDDIIIPSEAYERLSFVLGYLGFKVNELKSFHEGPFRESCGCDYWQGMDVRPIFLKKCPDYFDLFSLHNGLMRKHRSEWAEKVLDVIPTPLRLFGPDGYGDGHLIGHPCDLRRKPEHAAKGWSGYTFDTWSRKGRKYTRPHAGDYLYPSYSIYRRGEMVLPDSVVERYPGILLSDPKGEESSLSLPGHRGYRRLSIYTLDNTSI